MKGVEAKNSRQLPTVTLSAAPFRSRITLRPYGDSSRTHPVTFYRGPTKKSAMASIRDNARKVVCIGRNYAYRAFSSADYKSSTLTREATKRPHNGAK